MFLHFTLAFIPVLTIATCQALALGLPLHLYSVQNLAITAPIARFQAPADVAVRYQWGGRRCAESAATNTNRNSQSAYLTPSSRYCGYQIVRCPRQPGGHSFVRGGRQHKKAPRNRRSCHQKCKSPGLRQLQCLFRLTRTCIRGRHLQHVQVRLASNI
jgi:hypothetical protein